MPAPNATRHDSFTLARHLDAPPAAVFAVFADTELWRKWFRMPGSAASYEHDFQVGGLDLAQSAFTHPDGRRYLSLRWPASSLMAATSTFGLRSGSPDLSTPEWWSR